MEEGLLLDGVDLEAADVAVRDIERSRLVVTDLADPGTTRADETPMAAGEAGQGTVRMFLVQLPLARQSIQGFRKGDNGLRHGIPPSRCPSGHVHFTPFGAGR